MFPHQGLGPECTAVDYPSVPNNVDFRKKNLYKFARQETVVRILLQHNMHARNSNSGSICCCQTWLLGSAKRTADSFVLACVE